MDDKQLLTELALRLELRAEASRTYNKEADDWVFDATGHKHKLEAAALRRALAD